MNNSQAKHYLLSKPEAIEVYPFGPDVTVFKVKNKMFATLALGNGTDNYWMNLKCEPSEALMIRDIFPSVIPGYHMNKHHWNTVILDDTVPKGEIERMMDNSFLLVVKGMTKADRRSIELVL
ncbi:MAG: MmcQ/YjbR family DNA-binding protein [Algicola sp.]|nr:MmcQ/YjbR family DNA-binding protein [Algicola sp.]